MMKQITMDQTITISCLDYPDTSVTVRQPFTDVMNVNLDMFCRNGYDILFSNKHLVDILSIKANQKKILKDWPFVSG